MAAVTTNAVIEYLVDYSNDSANSTNLDNFVSGPLETRIDELKVFADTSVPAASDVDVESWAVVSHDIAPSFLDDFYFRVHALPNRIDLGNLLSTQTRTFEVWSAYFNSNTLLSLGQQGAESIDLTEPQSAPTVFAPLESRIYSLSISTQGSPTINATYTLNFASESRTVEVVGQRVVVWQNMPQRGYTEALSWYTDIIKSYDTEQKLSVRHKPRQSFTYKYLLNPESFSKLRILNSEWSNRVYGTPIWHDRVYHPGEISALSTRIYIDTTMKDFRQDGTILVWSSDSSFISLEITGVQPTYVDLKLPLSQAWSNVYICPIVFTRTLSEVKYIREANENIECSVTFTSINNLSLEDDSAWPQHRSKPVFNLITNPDPSIEESMSRQYSLIDNNSGFVGVDDVNSWSEHRQKISVMSWDQVEKWNLRRFIHARRGKQKGFFFPTWNNDFKIIQDVSDVSQSLIVEKYLFGLYYGPTDCMIELYDGTQIFCQILSITSSASEESFSLAEQVGTAFTVDQVKLACFMNYVRLDSDTVNLRFTDNDIMNIDVTTVETPYG